MRGRRQSETQTREGKTIRPRFQHKNRRRRFSGGGGSEGADAVLREGPTRRSGSKRSGSGDTLLFCPESKPDLSECVTHWEAQRPASGIHPAKLLEFELSHDLIFKVNNNKNTALHAGLFYLFAQLRRCYLRNSGKSRGFSYCCWNSSHDSFEFARL